MPYRTGGITENFLLSPFQPGTGRQDLALMVATVPANGGAKVATTAFEIHGLRINVAPAGRYMPNLDRGSVRISSKTEARHAGGSVFIVEDEVMIPNDGSRTCWKNSATALRPKRAEDHRSHHMLAQAAT